MAIDFTDRGSARMLLDSNWTAPDEYGTWTIGRRATLMFRLDVPEPRPVPLRFRITDCVAGLGMAPLGVRVAINDQIVEEWWLSPARTIQEYSVLVSSEAVATSRNITLALEILDPRTPAELGWSADDLRPLGIRVTEVMVGKAEASGQVVPASSPARQGNKTESRTLGLIATLLGRIGIIAQRSRR
jgi:hypothetical protein